VSGASRTSRFDKVRLKIQSLATSAACKRMLEYFDGLPA
jgi:hypothetical protein